MFVSKAAVVGGGTMGGEIAQAVFDGDLKGGGKFFSDVRWEETKAYAMGLGNLYLNLKGRETLGCDRAQRVSETDRIEIEIHDGGAYRAGC